MIKSLFRDISFVYLENTVFSKNGFYVLKYGKIRYTYRRINSRKVER